MTTWVSQREYTGMSFVKECLSALFFKSLTKEIKV